MEMGYIAFQTLVTHHAAFECARIGSLLAGPVGVENSPNPGANLGMARSRAQSALTRMIRNAKILKFQVARHRFSDPQTESTNADLVVEIENPVRLIFPGSSRLLASKVSSSAKISSNIRRIRAVVRMPIEVPYSKTVK